MVPTRFFNQKTQACLKWLRIFIFSPNECPVTKIYFSIILAPVSTTTTKTTTIKPQAKSTAKIAEANTYCYDEDTDYEGNDLTNIGDNPIKNIANAHDCQEKCHFTQDCTHWTYMPTTYMHEKMAEYKGSCWLKYGTGKINSFLGIFSGPKYCREYQ